MEHRTRRIAAGVLAAALVVVAACGSSENEHEVALGDEARALAVRLAQAGIAVLAEPSGEPIEAVVEPESPVRLLVWQVHAMELQARNGGGVLASELDAIAATAPGEPTASEMVLAWAVGAPTPAAALAREFVGDQVEMPDVDLSALDADSLAELDRRRSADFAFDATDVTLSDLVLVLFLSDVAAAADLVAEIDGGDEGAGSAAPGGLAALAGPAMLVPASVSASTPGGICSAVVGFVRDVISNVFSVIPKLPEVRRFPWGSLPGFVTDLLTGIANGAVWLWNTVVDGARVVVEGTVLTVTSALLEPIARVAGLVGTLAQIASLMRPWEVTITPEPAVNRKGIAPEGPQPGAVTAGVDLGGYDEWPAHIADCARQAGAPLPPLRPSGNAVQWFALETPPGLVGRVDGFVGTLAADGNARLTYETTVESAELASRGTPAVGRLFVSAQVARDDTHRILQTFEQLLRAELGSIAGVLQPTVWAIVQPQLDAILRDLLAFRDAVGYDDVAITYHVPEDEPPPTPRPRPTPPATSPSPGGPGSGSPGSGPCRSGCAESIGDPHLTTVDGTEYEFQGAGEFVLLRGAGGTVEVQVRYEPLFRESEYDVSVHTAVAARVGDHRVGWYDTGELRVDGEPVTGTGRLILGEGWLAHELGMTTVGFPDGTVMYLVGTSILIDPSDDLRSDGVGLLGRVDPGGFAVPPLPDGTTLPGPLDADAAFEALYRRFGPAWLVSEDASLFDYREGEASADFFLPDFPQPARSLLDLDALDDALRLAGEAACGGLDDARLFARCVFDVGVTGDTTWADGYVVTEGVLVGAAQPPSEETHEGTSDERAPDQPGGAAPAPGRQDEPAVRIAGTVDSLGTPLNGAVQAVAGTVLVARAASCPASVEVEVTLRGSDDTFAGTRTWLCDTMGLVGALADDDDEVVPGEAYVWLASDGVYDVEISTSEGPVDVAVDVYVDPTPTIVRSTGDLGEYSGTYAVHGIADTVVFPLTHAGATVSFPSPVGFGPDGACGGLFFGAPDVGTAQVWNLGFCPHSDEVHVGYLAGLVVPVIVFGRTATPTEISLGPPG